MDFILNYHATCVIPNIDSTPCASINLIIFHMDPAVLSGSHDTTSYRARNSIFDKFRVRSRVAENNCSAFWLHITLLNCGFALLHVDGKLVFALDTVVVVIICYAGIPSIIVIFLLVSTIIISSLITSHLLWIVIIFFLILIFIISLGACSSRKRISFRIVKSSDGESLDQTSFTMGCTRNYIILTTSQFNKAFGNNGNLLVDIETFLTNPVNTALNNNFVKIIGLIYGILNSLETTGRQEIHVMYYDILLLKRPQYQWTFIFVIIFDFILKNVVLE